MAVPFVRSRLRGRTAAGPRRIGWLLPASAALLVLAAGLLWSSQQTEMVVVAKRIIPPHTLLSVADVEMAPVTRVGNGIPGAMANSDLVVGHYTLAPLAAGQAILPGAIDSEASTGGGRIVNGVPVPGGLTLVSGSVNLDEAAGGFIAPGAKVNLLRLPGGNTGAPDAGQASQIFAENVLVVAVNAHNGVAPGNLPFIGKDAGAAVDGSSARVTFAAPADVALQVSTYSSSHRLALVVPVAPSTDATPSTSAASN